MKDSRCSREQVKLWVDDGNLWLQVCGQNPSCVTLATGESRELSRGSSAVKLDAGSKFCLLKKTNYEFYVSKASSSKREEREDNNDNEHKGDLKKRRVTRPACKYGAGCYRRNADHRAQYSHPNDDDYNNNNNNNVEDDVELHDDNDDDDVKNKKKKSVIQPVAMDTASGRLMPLSSPAPPISSLPTPTPNVVFAEPSPPSSPLKKKVVTTTTTPSGDAVSADILAEEYTVCPHTDNVTVNAVARPVSGPLKLGSISSQPTNPSQTSPQKTPKPITIVAPAPAVASSSELTPTLFFPLLSCNTTTAFDASVGATVAADAINSFLRDHPDAPLQLTLVDSRVSVKDIVTKRVADRRRFNILSAQDMLQATSKCAANERPSFIGLECTWRLTPIPGSASLAVAKAVRLGQNAFHDLIADAIRASGRSAAEVGSSYVAGPIKASEFFSQSALPALQNVQFIVATCVPNVNPNKSNPIENAEEAAQVLKTSYESMFDGMLREYTKLSNE